MDELMDAQIADFAINAAQLPCRVLATDIVEESLQETVMARFSVTDNAGKVVAYLLGSLSLAHEAWAFPGDTPFIVDVRVQFGVAVCWILLSFITVCTFIVEGDSRSANAIAASDSKEKDKKNKKHKKQQKQDNQQRLLEGDAEAEDSQKATARATSVAGGGSGVDETAAAAAAGGGGAGRDQLSTCGQMGASLGVIRDKVIATFSSKAGDPLVPLKHCCQVEMLAWVCWAVLDLWGPMCVS